MDSTEDLPTDEDKWMDKVWFSVKHIKKAVATQNSEAPGPSSIKQRVVKKTIYSIMEYIHILIKNMLKERKIQMINRVGQIWVNIFNFICHLNFCVCYHKNEFDNNKGLKKGLLTPARPQY